MYGGRDGAYGSLGVWRYIDLAIEEVTVDIFFLFGSRKRAPKSGEDVRRSIGGPLGPGVRSNVVEVLFVGDRDDAWCPTGWRPEWQPVVC